MFFPSSQSPALHLDTEMRLDLALSLERLGVMAAAVLPGEVDMSAAVARIRTDRIEPAAFALYYNLIHTLQAEDFGRARGLWRDIAQVAMRPVQLELIPYDAILLGADAARFQHLFAMGWQEAVIFAAPDAGNWRRFHNDAVQALDLLATLSPAWSHELDALLTRVYGALPPEAEGRRFAGASSFMVWGAIFLNVRKADNRIRVLAGLVHEATHQLLFGASRRQPLAANNPTSRYASPLRSDPRPMDGVFHATYVSARLAYLYGLLSEAEVTDAERAYAGEKVERQRRRFEQGLAVLRDQGQLTPLGMRLMEEAREAMMDAVVA